MIGPEALGLEGNIALGADVDSLCVPLAHLQAHLAVPGGPLPMLVELCLSDPVISYVIPVSRKLFM